MEELTGYENAARLALALGIGLLVGIERGWHTRDQSGGVRVAGVRTYALSGLLGGVWGFLGAELGDVVLGIAFLGFAALVILAYRTTARKEGDYGLTSEIAVLLVFALGVMAVRGDMALAAGAGVVTVALLDAKRYLHTWVRHLNALELDGAIKLLVISVVVLPVLPNKGFGPDEVLNPYKLWWMVVLIAGLSFMGYIAIRKIGERVGVLLTGVFGGLASSTAVTLGFARLGKKTPAASLSLVGGIAASSTIMYVRVVIVVGLFNASLLSGLTLPMLLMALTSAAASVVLFQMAGRKATSAAIEIDNPCDISMAVKFSVLLGAVMLASHYMRLWLGSAGVYALAALSGLADVDAISLSMAEQAQQGFDSRSAITAIVIAVAVNSLVKVAFVGFAAGRKMLLPMAAVTAAAVVAGAIGLIVNGAL